MAADDLELIDRWRQGDQSAASELVTRHYPPILNYLHHLGAERGDAEDLTQEAFIRLTRTVRAGLRLTSPRAFLYRCATNLWRDRLRQRVRLRRKGMWPAADPASLVDEPAPEGTEALVEAHWRHEAVRNALAALTPAQREVIALRYFHDLDYEAIARICDVPLGTVRSRLHYGVMALRRQLEPEEGVP